MYISYLSLTVFTLRLKLILRRKGIFMCYIFLPGIEVDETLEDKTPKVRYA